MRGERIPLSRIRVTVNDLLDLSRDFPSIPVQRTINVSAVLQELLSNVVDEVS